MKKLIHEFKIEEHKNPLFKVKTPPESQNKVKKRVLEDGEADPDAIPELFKSGLKSSVILGTWSSKFEGDGISMYDIGVKTSITQTLYDEVKTYLTLEIRGSLPTNKLTSKD